MPKAKHSKTRPHHPPHDPFLRISEIIEHTKTCRMTLYNWQRQGIFPPFVKLGPNVAGMRQSTLDAWFNQREKGERS